jgi:hypothetical protein
MGLLALLIAAALPPCPISQLGPGQSATRPTSRGTVILTPFMSNNGRTCEMHARLVMSLRSRGRILDVRGNPATIDFTGRLGAKEFHRAAFTWRNWCGGVEHVRVWVAMRGEGGWMSIGSEVPQCVDATQPSTLTGPVRSVTDH